jgi:hypothetical protein
MSNEELELEECDDGGGLSEYLVASAIASSGIVDFWTLVCLWFGWHTEYRINVQRMNLGVPCMHDAKIRGVDCPFYSNSSTTHH